MSISIDIAFVNILLGLVSSKLERVWIRQVAIRNRHFCCARLIHIPTGLKQERQGRSKDANYREAMAALITILDDRLQSGSKAAEDDVRRQQIGSGMRGDKRRTYRFQDDIVTDHITGKSMQASRAIRGGISILW